MKIGIIGSGIMGRGIAQLFVSYGYSTYLYDVSIDILENAKKEIIKRLTHEVEKNRMNVIEKNEALNLLQINTDYQQELDTLDVIIECVPEDLELKRSIVSNIHSIDPAIIIASNTSSISITKMANVSSSPENIIGMHFFNPAPVIKLVEVIYSPQTSKQAIELIVEIAEDIDKEPIIVKDFPGFASSRLGVVIGLEAIRMVEQGVASVEDIDKAMKLGYRHPMGPLELTDYVGLDTRLKIAEYLDSSDISPSFDIPELLREMVNNGKLGRKVGEGFYKWKNGKKLINE